MKKVFEEQRVEVELTAEDIEAALHNYVSGKYTDWAAATSRDFSPNVTEDGEYSGGGTIKLAFSPSNPDGS